VDGWNWRISLHPPHVQLDVRALRSQRIQLACGAPGQEATQIRLGVHPRHALEPGQVGGHRQPQPINTNNKITRTGESHFRSRHTRPGSAATTPQ